MPAGLNWSGPTPGAVYRAKPPYISWCGAPRVEGMVFQRKYRKLWLRGGKTEAGLPVAGVYSTEFRRLCGERETNCGGKACHEMGTHDHSRFQEWPE